jgi:hypothetical protein
VESDAKEYVWEDTREEDTWEDSVKTPQEKRKKIHNSILAAISSGNSFPASPIPRNLQPKRVVTFVASSASPINVASPIVIYSASPAPRESSLDFDTEIEELEFNKATIMSLEESKKIDLPPLKKFLLTGELKEFLLARFYRGLYNGSSFCFANAVLQCLANFKPFQNIEEGAVSSSEQLVYLKTFLSDLNTPDFVGNMLNANSLIHNLYNYALVLEFDMQNTPLVKKNGDVYTATSTDPLDFLQLMVFLLDNAYKEFYGEDKIFSKTMKIGRTTEITCLSPVDNTQNVGNQPDFVYVVSIESFNRMQGCKFKHQCKITSRDNNCECGNWRTDCLKTETLFIPEEAKGIIIQLNRTVGTIPIQYDPIICLNTRILQLCGIVCASKSRRHYVAFCKRNENWYNFDDDRSTQIGSLDDVLALGGGSEYENDVKTYALLLFYNVV